VSILNLLKKRPTSVFLLFCEKDLGDFYVTIIYDDKCRKKIARNFVVKSVTILLVTNLTGINIYPLQSIKMVT